MNKEETTKFIHDLFEKDFIEHSDIIWSESSSGEIAGTFYVRHIGNEQLLPLIALYDIIILPIWEEEFEKNKKTIEELGGPQDSILIEINNKR